ncbi:MAG: metallophosphoesterase [Phycisphaerae bacterium]
MDTAVASNTERARHTRRRLAWAALFLLIAAGTGGYSYLDRRYQPELVAGPMVQMPRAGELAIVWRAEAQGETEGALRCPASGAAVKASVNQAGYFVARRETSAIGDGGQYAIFNSGLFSRMHELKRGTLAAPPPRDHAIRFLAFGDSGNGSHTQRGLAERMIAARPDLVIHLGDLIYPAGSPEDYVRNFFEPYRELLARAPFMPSLGNHDVATQHGQPFLDVFTLPENGPPGLPAERNYWFDFGPARFVALDTNRAEEGGAISQAEMREKVAPWLRTVLSRCDRPWKFAYFHHPPFTGSTHKASEQEFVRDIFVPLFDEFAVDVVFAGHNHLYERTQPLRRGQVAAPGAGTVYVVSGAGGVSRYPEEPDAPAYIATSNSAVFSFTQVDLSPARLELRQVSIDGAVIDALTIERPAAAR